MYLFNFEKKSNVMKVNGNMVHLNLDYNMLVFIYIRIPIYRYYQWIL